MTIFVEQFTRSSDSHNSQLIQTLEIRSRPSSSTSQHKVRASRRRMAPLQTLPRLIKLSTTLLSRKVSEPEFQNSVLGTLRTTPINPKEKRLNGKTQCTLSQMRSGFCFSLEDYTHRTRLSTNNICPCCRREEQIVQPVFECLDHPPSISPLNIWTCPILAAKFFLRLPRRRESSSRTSTSRPPQHKMRENFG